MISRRDCAKVQQLSESYRRIVGKIRFLNNQLTTLTCDSWELQSKQNAILTEIRHAEQELVDRLNEIRQYIHGVAYLAHRRALVEYYNMTLNIPVQQLERVA